MKYKIECILVFGIIISLSYPSCKHEPLVDVPIVPIDTLDTVPNPVDTPLVGIPCNPDTVYFQNEILPLLVSNCTESNCHNALDKQSGVILDSYANILGTVDDVTNNDWQKNELMEVLVLNQPDKRMPPAPNAALSLIQIDRIAKWIAQGARNNQCSEQSGSLCDTTMVRYTNFVRPLIQGKCQGCHGGSNPQGGVDLSSYAKTKVFGQNGKLLSAITRTSNWMPKNGQKLDACSISKIQAWVKAGTPE